MSYLPKENRVTSALIGASRVEQIEENVNALKNTQFSTDQLKKIDQIFPFQSKESTVLPRVNFCRFVGDNLTKMIELFFGMFTLNRYSQSCRILWYCRGANGGDEKAFLK